MAKNGTVAYVESMPDCDVHGDHPAEYDISYVPYNGRLTWGFVCKALMEEYAARLHKGSSDRLGTGIGQKLVLESERSSDAGG